MIRDDVKPPNIYSKLELRMDTKLGKSAAVLISKHGKNLDHQSLVIDKHNLQIRANILKLLKLKNLFWNKGSVILTKITLAYKYIRLLLNICLIFQALAKV